MLENGYAIGNGGFSLKCIFNEWPRNMQERLTFYEIVYHHRSKTEQNTKCFRRTRNISQCKSISHQISTKRRAKAKN